METNEIKELAAKTAVNNFVKNNMKLGLGTGSTAIHAVRHLGALLARGKLSGIRVVSTSFQTTIECENLGIPLFTLNSGEIKGILDLTIDGADEVDTQNRCIKGGGGALLLEKIIAYASIKYAIIVDESKMVKNLGLNFPVPVEVIPEARLTVTRRLEEMGAEVKLREALRKAGPVITDKGNLLLDIRFKEEVNPADLEAEINRIPGVIENGFFTGPGRSLPGLRQTADNPFHPIIITGYRDGRVEQRD